MNFTDSEKRIFYSPVLKKMTINGVFKRPKKVWPSVSSTCLRCGCPSITTTHNPPKKPFLDINRTVCPSGHVDVSFHSRINYQKSRMKV